MKYVIKMNRVSRTNTINVCKFVIFSLFVLSVFLNGCSKPEYNPIGVASLTIFKAIGGPDLRTNFRGTEPIKYANSSTLRYGTSSRYSLPAGENKLGLFAMPDTLADSEPLYFFNFDLPNASIHTLFLVGTLDRPESILVEENIPIYARTDSMMGVRFINLSVNSPKLTVNLKDEQAGSEIASLSYKEHTAFLPYEVKPTQPDYIFEFRREDTGELLFTYRTENIGALGTSADPNTWIRRNFTLAFIGDVDAVDESGPQVRLIRHTGS